MGTSALELAGANFPSALAEHRPKVRRFLGARLPSAIADEATQETFVRAFVRRDTLEDPARLGPWLFGIAKRVLAEERRRHKKACARAGADDAIDLLPSPSDQHAELAVAQASALIDRSVAALPAAKRSALLLRVDEDLSYAEIATRMGWSIPKVKNEIHRARTVLRAAIAVALCAITIAIIPRSREVATFDDGPLACFDSGLGLIAAFEAERAACLMASPVPTIDSVDPICESTMCE
jgi:RNA polymerase sigma-70 factor, ECF subfamily